MLILDVRTRWTSTHQMLRRALHNKASIDSYVRNNLDLADAALTDKDWDALRQVRSWLSNFRTATTDMSTTSKPMLSQTHLVFCDLQRGVKKTLRELPGNVAPELKTGLLAAHKKLSDYYFTFDASPYYLWASLLDPRIGYTNLKDDVFKDQYDLLADLETAKASLEAEFRHNYLPDAQPPPATEALARALLISEQMSRRRRASSAVSALKRPEILRTSSPATSRRRPSHCRMRALTYLLGGTQIAPHFLICTRWQEISTASLVRSKWIYASYITVERYQDRPSQ
ncbi:hypothetical protein FB45DRAFT_248536 [Roridomyces roridus]|uniref:Transposase n=1 Tax=Roridomyces roridus TaxID=1738132 RepID=A0AAD7BA70_9AGAR|nr:hypothetical protein FB45DRAFT_248536 [Roridomyces roridus]